MCKIKFLVLSVKKTQIFTFTVKLWKCLCILMATIFISERSKGSWSTLLCALPRTKWAQHPLPNRFFFFLVPISCFNFVWTLMCPGCPLPQSLFLCYLQFHMLFVKPYFLIILASCWVKIYVLSLPPLSRSLFLSFQLNHQTLSVTL